MRRRVAVGRVVGVLFLVAGLAVSAYFALVQADEPVPLRVVGTTMGLIGAIAGTLVAWEFHRLKDLPWHDPGVAQAKLAKRVEPLASAGTIAAIACSLAATLASRLS